MEFLESNTMELMEKVLSGIAPDGYKKTKAGIIPTEWNCMEINQMIEGAHLGGNYTNTTEDNGIPLIKMGNIGRGNIILNGLNYITDEELNKEDLLEEGDLLFNTRNTLELVGKVAVWKSELPEAYYNSNLLKLSFKKKYVKNNYFMNYLFNSAHSIKTLRRIATGTTSVAAIYTKDLLNCNLVIPPLPEQQRIAEILLTWEKAIELKEQLISEKKQQKKGLMKRLLTGEMRLPDFECEWEETRLKDLFERVIRKNTEGSTNVLTISAQHGLINQEDFFNKSVASAILDNYYLLRNGEFAYNKSYSNGYPMGAIKRLHKYESGVVTTLYICFKLSDEISNNASFYEHYFESGLLIVQLMQIAHEGGRAHGLLNVSPNDFFELEIKRPSIEEQTQIAEILKVASTQIELEEKELELLKLQKKGLMQLLLTGIVRVQC